LTSLFGGIGEADRRLTMGAVEPLCEKAMEPLEHDTEGESGAGLGFLLDCCELEMLESRLIHERRREGTWERSSSATSWSLGAYPPGAPLGSWSAVSPLVILLTMRRRDRRPSKLGRVESGGRAVEATDIGALEAGASVVVAEVWTAVVIDP
jgi:hypothetical protein